MKLTPTFLSQYEKMNPPWGFGRLGEIVYMRTYSRPLANGKSERWWQTVQRVVEGIYRAQFVHCEKNGLPWNAMKAQRSAQTMYDKIFRMKFLPPGRGLWAMGTEYVEQRGSAALNNCFAGDVRFWADGKLTYFQDAPEQVSVLCIDGRWRPARVCSYGEQELQSVTFRAVRRSNHRVSFPVTANHRWILHDGTVTTALKVGDRVVVSPTPWSNSAVFERGFIHGVFFGDGTQHTYYPERFMVRLCGGKAKWADAVKCHPGFVSCRDVDGDPYITVTDPTTSLKSIPTTESLEYQAGFLAGWIEMDGHDKRSGSVCLDSQDRAAVDWLISVSGPIGYVVKGHSVWNADTNYGKRSAPLHRVSLSARPEVFTVVSIAPWALKETVYCVEEPETKSFVLEGGLPTGNCAFVTTAGIKQDFSDPFCFLMDMSMLGVGVGGDTRGSGTVVIKEPQGSQQHVVEDSREGWVQSVRVLLDSFMGQGGYPTFDYSRVRPAGEPLRGFGGIASGPGPLQSLHTDLSTMYLRNVGKPVTSSIIVDTFNLIGRAVVAGGIRRSAEIMLGMPDDQEFLQLKDPDLHATELTTHRWASNNSLIVPVGAPYHKFTDQIMKNGEPGFFWLDNSREFRRMKDPRGEWDTYVMGQNPCQRGTDTLLTPHGIRMIKDVQVHHLIWTGMGWSRLIGKQSAGVKPVFAYRTTGGTFYGTGEHRVMEYGLKVPAKDASAIDLSPDFPTWHKHKDYLPGAVMDGIVLGDGSVHRASNDLVYLCVGKEDECYTGSEVSHLLVKCRPGLSKYAWEVQTSLTASELPRTYYREIPARYRFGTPQVVRSFLRGLFSANGSVCGARVTLKASSFTVIEQVQEMLASLGIRSYYTTNRAHQVEFENGAYECKESYDLNITTGRNRFNDWIGFVHPDKQARLEKICEIPTSQSKSTYDIIRVDALGEEEVFNLTVEADEHTYWTGGLWVANCGEISLESREFCNLVEVYPAHHEDETDFELSLKWAYLYAKTVSLIPTHDRLTNAIIGRNRRLGISVSGVVQAMKKFGTRRLFNMLDGGYDYLRRLDKMYSQWLCVPESIKLTTVKPSGTVSLLAGATPGIHFPHSEFYVRNVKFDPQSPLLEKLRKSGYPIEKSAYDDNTFVVSFPVHEGLFTKGKADVSLWEQFELAAQMQYWWADNSVSVTVSVGEDEAGDLAQALALYDSRLKSVSILPLNTHGYAQAPYTKVDEDAYLKMAAGISLLKLHTDDVHDVEEMGCTNDSCSLF